MLNFKLGGKLGNVIEPQIPLDDHGMSDALKGIRNAIKKLDEQSGIDERLFKGQVVGHISVDNISQSRLTPASSMCGNNNGISKSNIEMPFQRHSKPCTIADRDKSGVISFPHQSNIQPRTGKTSIINQVTDDTSQEQQASTAAIMALLQTMQGRVRHLEEERKSVIMRCNELKQLMRSVEAKAKVSLNRTATKAKGWTSAQTILLKKLEENRSGMEKELACLSEETESLSTSVQRSRDRATQLEGSRRNLEARANAHRDRNRRLTLQLEETEIKASHELVTAMSVEAGGAERFRVLEAKLAASDILKSTIEGELLRLSEELRISEGVLCTVVGISKEVSRINAEAAKNPRPEPDPHYSKGTTTSKIAVKAKLHPCIKQP